MPIVLVIYFLSVYLHHSILSPSEIINTLSLPPTPFWNTIYLIYMGNSERHRCISVSNVETNVLKRLMPIEAITAVIFSINKTFLSNSRSVCGIPHSSNRLQSYPTIYVSIQDEVFCLLLSLFNSIHLIVDN